MGDDQWVPDGAGLLVDVLAWLLVQGSQSLSLATSHMLFSFSSAVLAWGKLKSITLSYISH